MLSTLGNSFARFVFKKKHVIHFIEYHSHLTNFCYVFLTPLELLLFYPGLKRFRFKLIFNVLIIVFSFRILIFKNKKYQFNP